MGLSDKPGDDKPGTQPKASEPDSVMVTFHTWLDHILTCDHCHCGATARHCYHSERLGDRHREVERASRRRH